MGFDKGFYRASTATHTFYPSIPLSEIDEMRICYSQEEEVIIKTLDDCTKDNENNSLTIELTQEDTKKFRNGNVKIQIRALTKENKVATTRIFTTMCKDVLDDEVMQ